MPSRSTGAVAHALAAAFLLLAALHLFWALTRVPDGVRPTLADETLAQPPIWVTAGVAVPLTLAAAVALARAGRGPSRLAGWVPRVGCWGVGLVLVFRAVGEFRFVGFFKSVRETQFAALDSWLYSPLCLVLGLAALWLAVRSD